jgi:hypothetical protein
MEPHYLTVSQMYERMQAMIRQRSDSGGFMAAADALLEPRNPFAKNRRRRPRPAVVLIAFVLCAFAAIFLYFSVHHAG